MSLSWHLRARLNPAATSWLKNYWSKCATSKSASEGASYRRAPQEPRGSLDAHHRGTTRRNHKTFAGTCPCGATSYMHGNTNAKYSSVNISHQPHFALSIHSRTMPKATIAPTTRSNAIRIGGGFVTFREVSYGFSSISPPYRAAKSSARMPPTLKGPER